MAISRKSLTDLIALLGVGLIVAVGYKFSPLLLPDVDIAATPLPGCDLHRQSCTARLPSGGTVELSITPRPIPTLKTLKVDVRTTGLTPDRVEIDFNGIDMNMGINRATLAEVGINHHEGQATLPICATGKMAWQATVLIRDGRTRIAAPFRFDST